MKEQRSGVHVPVLLNPNGGYFLNPYCETVEELRQNIQVVSAKGCIGAYFGTNLLSEIADLEKYHLKFVDSEPSWLSDLRESFDSAIRDIVQQRLFSGITIGRENQYHACGSHIFAINTNISVRNCYVYAYNSTIQAYGISRVIAEKSVVVANNQSQVELIDGSTCLLQHDSVGVGYGNSVLLGSGRSTVALMDKNTKGELSEHSVGFSEIPENFTIVEKTANVEVKFPKGLFTVGE